MPIRFVQSTSVFDHHPLRGGVDLLLFRPGNEKVNLWRILLKTLNWPAGDNGDQGLILEHVVFWTENNKTAGDETL